MTDLDLTETLATAAADAVRARRTGVEAGDACPSCASTLGIRFAEAAS